MKKIAYLLLTALLPAVSCNLDMEYNAGEIAPIPALYSPADGHYVQLASGNGYSVVFNWAPTSASDGMPPMYELVFYDDATSDKEVGRISAGATTSLTVTHKDLNKIMNLRGVLPDATGDIYWSVVASRAANDTRSHPTPRKLTLKRLKGFKVPPEMLYITGPATEAGDDIAEALKFQRFSEGEVYEIFTRLTDGAYNIADGNTASARLFGINGGILQEEVSTPVNNTLGEGVYRIRVDLATSSVTIDLVENVRYVMCPAPEDPRMLTYVGNGVWKGENLLSNFVGLRNDDRYFFRADIGGVNQKIGNDKVNYGPAPANTESLEAIVYLQPEGVPEWDYSFKVIPFYNSSVGLRQNVELYLNASKANYYHRIEFPDYQ